MPLTASIATATPEQNELSVALIPGLIALGIGTAVQTLAFLPSPISASHLTPTLLLCALLQIGVGLFEWRRERIFFSATFVAFGLFTCSQVHQLALRSAEGQAVTGGLSLLVLWSLFALLMAGGAEDRLFRAVLGSVAVTLLAKALFLGFGLTAAWALVVATGLATAILAAYTSYRIVTHISHG